MVRVGDPAPAWQWTGHATPPLGESHAARPAPERPTTARAGAARGRRVAPLAAAAVAVGLVLTAVSAAAAPPTSPPQLVFDQPAGVACDFPLKIYSTGGSPRTHDAHGVAITTRGGQALTFVNDATGDTFSTPSNGSNTRVTTLADGTQRWEALGHTLLILFPSDVPAGPTTTIYTGRIVFTVAPDLTYTLLSTSGRSLDVCAELS